MPAKTKPPKGKGKGLAKKVGPLPLGAWIGLLAIAGVIGYLYWKRRQAGASAASTDSGGFLSPQQATPQDMASAGAPSTATPAGSQLSPDVLDQLSQLAQSQNAIGSLLNTLPDRISESIAANFGGTGPGGDISYPGGGGGSDSGTGGGPNGTGADMSVLSHLVHWGSSYYATRSDIAAVLAKHGVSYAHWAALHPSAAARLTGPIPKAPVHKAPHPTTRTSTRAPSRPPAAHRPPAASTHRAPPKKAPPRRPSGPPRRR